MIISNTDNNATTIYPVVLVASKDHPRAPPISIAMIPEGGEASSSYERMIDKDLSQHTSNYRQLHIV